MNARELMNAMLAHDPEVRSIDAGSASYRWLLAHVVEWAAGETSIIGELPVQERTDLPPNLIVFSGADGNLLSSIEVTELDDASDKDT